MICWSAMDRPRQIRPGSSRHAQPLEQRPGLAPASAGASMRLPAPQRLAPHEDVLRRGQVGEQGGLLVDDGDPGVLGGRRAVQHGRRRRSPAAPRCPAGTPRPGSSPAWTCPRRSRRPARALPRRTGRSIRPRSRARPRTTWPRAAATAAASPPGPGRGRVACRSARRCLVGGSCAAVSRRRGPGDGAVPESSAGVARLSWRSADLDLGCPMDACRRSRPGSMDFSPRVVRCSAPGPSSSTSAPSGATTGARPRRPLAPASACRWRC